MRSEGVHKSVLIINDSVNVYNKADASSMYIILSALDVCPEDEMLESKVQLRRAHLSSRKPHIVRGSCVVLEVITFSILHWCVARHTFGKLRAWRTAQCGACRHVS